MNPLKETNWKQNYENWLNLFDRVLFDQFVDAASQLDEDAMRDVIKFMRFIIEKEKEGKEGKNKLLQFHFILVHI